MSLLTSKTELREQLDATKAQLEASEASVQTLTSDLETVRADVTERDQAIAENTAKIAELTEGLATEAANAADLTGKLAEQVTATETAEKSAEAKASAILAAAGHPVIEEDNASDTISDEQIKKQFAAMNPGAKRSAFYQANRDILTQ